MTIAFGTDYFDLVTKKWRKKISIGTPLKSKSKSWQWVLTRIKHSKLITKNLRILLRNRQYSNNLYRLSWKSGGERLRTWMPTFNPNIIRLSNRLRWCTRIILNLKQNRIPLKISFMGGKINMRLWRDRKFRSSTSWEWLWKIKKEQKWIGRLEIFRIDSEIKEISLKLK